MARATATPAKAKTKTKAKAKPAKPKAKAKAKPKASATKPAPPRARPQPDQLRAIRSVIYTVGDLAQAKAFYAMVLGREPYFDQPFYAGFDVDGQELGLDPDTSNRQPGPGGSVTYWRVGSIAEAWTRLTANGAAPVEPPHGVGGNIETAIVGDPFGNLVGLIQIDD